MYEERIITIGDTEYPKLLKEIPDPPSTLYVKGTLDLGEKCFAVVGTRLCSPYGKQATLEIGGDVAKAGLVIVSGLAPGIDTFAHKAALERGGKTIAVLGTGLDEKSIYPKENIPLAKQILEAGGALISEYPPGTPGSKITFPQRNRIISGMSLGVLVVEAKQRSGSLITAHYAIKHKRKLFAVPGSIYSLNSRGTNFAIKKLGAKLVESAADILEELGMKAENEKQRLTGDTTEESLVLEILRGAALPIDDIIEKTHLPSGKVASILAILEIKGKVRNLGNNIYAIGNR